MWQWRRGKMWVPALEKDDGRENEDEDDKKERDK
jgi:hypothetical protein